MIKVLPLFYNLFLVFLSYFFEIKLLLALGTEVIQIFDDPLPDAFLMEDMIARQHDCILHVIITNCAGEIMKFIQILSFEPLQQRHRGGQFSDAVE